MSNIKLSVIIPVYNVEKYLEECINSVLSQTLKDIEIICVNDGSTDLCDKILDNYANIYNNIKVIKHKKTFGLSIARNNGFKVANGKYIYFLDSDDYLNDSNALEILFNECETNRLDIALFNADVIYENNYAGNETNLKEYYDYANICNKNFLENKLISGEELFNNSIKYNCYRQNVWLRVYRRDFLKNININFYENIINEDILYSIISDIKAKRVKHIGKSLYTYRRRNNSIMNGDNLRESIKGHYISSKELFKFLKEYDEIKSNEVTVKNLKYLIKKYYTLAFLTCDRLQDIDIRKNLISNIDKDLIDISMDILINQPNLYYSINLQDN